MFLPGSRTASPPVGHWVRVSPLGSGSFGSVSLAVNLDDGQLFAVKSTRSSSSSSPELSALENELSILQSLHSPRIIQCLGGDYSLQNGSFSLINVFLEHMEGGSVADLVKKSAGGRLDEGRVRSYTREILEGLIYLHERRIVHSDIKAQNILLGSSGVKIADFGAARRLGSMEIEEIGGYFKGTPLWMAPEVVRGVEQECPSDIWSLGCTVVEMLQGRPPWGCQLINGHTSASSLAAVLFKIGCSQEVVPLPESASAEARDFLSKCLQRDPETRWTAAQLLEHPFVKEQEKGDCLYTSQASPRSTLDFTYSRELEISDYESDMSVNIISFAGSWHTAFEAKKESTTASVHDHELLEVEACDWVTVRRANGWSVDRQKPFMKGSAAGGGAGEMAVRKACWQQVSFDSAVFLANRIRPRSAVVG